MPSQRAQAQLTAAALHPRLIPRASSEPITALRPVPDRFPSFAAGTPPTPTRGTPPATRERRIAAVRSSPAAQPRRNPPRAPASRRQATRPEPIRPRRARPAQPAPARARRPRTPQPRAVPAPVATPQPARPKQARATPAPAGPATLRTLETIPATAAAARAAQAAVAERTAPGTRPGGYVLAMLSGLLCTLLLSLAPLALVVALAPGDPRFAAGALAAPVLAPALCALLAAAILRAGQRRGWRPVAVVVTLTVGALAAAWAVRLAGPVLLDFAPADLVADPRAAWLAVRASIPGMLELVAAPRLLAAWSGEAVLILALLLSCGLRLRRSRRPRAA